MTRVRSSIHLASIYLLFAFSMLHAGPTLAQQQQGRFQAVTCRNSFTQEAEIAEGNKVALQVYQQMPVLPERDPVTSYIQQLGARLVQQAPLAPGVTQQWPFNFHVVASEDINAFALPGGSIFVNLGTIQAAETEAQLAGVMAHEISHVVMRHSTCNLGKQQKKSLLYGLGQIGSQLILGNGVAGQLGQSAIAFGQNADFLHMSRDDEKQADLLGVGILADTGYDPRGLPQFFEILRVKYGNGGSQFFSDHPDPGNRTQYVNAEIANLPARQNPLRNGPQFAQLHAAAQERKPLNAAAIKAGAWKGSGAYASAPGSNGGVIASTPASGQSGQPTPANYPSQNQPSNGGQPQSPQTRETIAPLARTRLGLRDRPVLYQAARWSMRRPSSWQSSTQQAGVSSGQQAQTNANGQDNGTVTLAPAGGAGSFGIAYGVLIGVEPQNGNGSGDVNAFSQAAAAMVQRFLSQDATLSQTGSMTSFTLGGNPAYAVDLRGTSPVRATGSGTNSVAEHDWLIVVQRPDGDLSYLVFVAPDRDYAALKPSFNAMLNSFTPQ